MRARDVIGRTIVEVRQQRVSTRITEFDWEVIGFRLDNGKWLTLFARETDDLPIVTAQVYKP